MDHSRSDQSISPSHSALADLFASVADFDLVLTPNRRLSRFLTSQFPLFRQLKVNAASGRNSGAWRSFRALSINGWLSSLWESYALVADSSLPKLMSAAEGKALWLDIVENNQPDEPLFNTQATSAACSSAWDSFVAWQLDEQPSNLQSPFSGWVELYQRRCSQLELIDYGLMVNRLIKVVEQGGLTLPASIALYAFDDITPQFDALLKALEQRGCRTKFLSAVVEQSCVKRCSLARDDEELSAAARWAAEKLQASPDHRIGIVVPQLASSRAKVERIFSDVFEPQYKLPFSTRHATPFNISAGTPLKDTGPVNAALQALRLNSRHINIELVQTLLRSPYISSMDELPQRAIFSADLQERFVGISTAALRAEVAAYGLTADDKEVEECSGWLGQLSHDLQAFQSSQHHKPASQAPSLWGKFFSEQLQLLGWPGTRPLDTLEYQQVESWYQTLRELSHFDYLFPSVDLQTALGLLNKLCAESQFQAQTKSSPVQILGILEAAGMIFDHLWVMGLNNEAWPPAPQPSALLPLDLQKKHNMPRASAQRELHLAIQLTRRFEQSAASVVFSHNNFDGEKELRASPLVSHIEPFSDVVSDPKVKSFGEINNAWGESLEYYLDEQGPEVAQVNELRGGTQILKDQAACPFRAFVRHRLHAKSLQPAEHGLNAAERGILIHQSLELIWRKLKDQKTLLSSTDSQLEACVKTCVEKAFTYISAGKKIGKVLRDLEISRVCNLLLNWLQLEKLRAPFSVLFNESSARLQLAGLPIRIRFDRIDRLEDGRLFVIDYKTGKTAIRDWAGLRPNEPQVPLYAIANQDDVAAVAFGQINVDDVAFAGIAAEEGMAKDVKAVSEHGVKELPEEWSQLLDHWRKVTEQLAKDFLNGDARVDPKSRNTSCRYCDLHSVCRIHESLEPVFFEDEEGAAL